MRSFSLSPERDMEQMGGTHVFLDVMRQEGMWTGFGAAAQDIVKMAGHAFGASGCLPFDRVSAAITLSNDERVCRLNSKYRGENKPTNVLSFCSSFQGARLSSFESAKEERFLGDVILAEETVLREATEQAVLPASYLEHLVVHGLLHLSGFDHKTEAEAQEMEDLERRVLESLKRMKE